jgi:hypothetical protein
MNKMIGLAEAATPAFARFDDAIDLSPYIDFQKENAWAVQKSLIFPRINVYYSLIPKNACTSILSTLAQANGLTSKWFQSRNRIHNIQSKYNAFNDLDRFHDDMFKIIAFRDPFKRFVSAFKNKLVSPLSENFKAHQFFEQRLDKPIVECRFSELVKVSDHYAHWALEQHFAPQWSFLFYDRYDLLIDADQPITALDIGTQVLPVGWHNHKSRGQADEHIGDAKVGEFRAFVARTGKDPRTEDLEQIFGNVIKPNSNFDCDFRLYRALRKGRSG